VEAELKSLTQKRLQSLLKQRELDRYFIDQRTRACFELSQKLGIDYLDPNYPTVIGHEDGKGRTVIGPKNTFYNKKGYGKPVAPLPDFLKGYHVTFFSPPESEKTCAIAMDTLSIQLNDEPKIVTELVSKSSETIKWGADFEDSVTPTQENLNQARKHLDKCFKSKNPTLPIKRLPGIALSHHVDELALHLSQHWNNPKALVFYVPKLENEEEASYLHHLIENAEKLIKKSHPEYALGTVRVITVLENARAVFRVNEIMDALYPYFAGASLGWHDYLASASRVFKEDPNYRVPVKADPQIVIQYVKASHELLAEVVGSRGGICIGGMYGVLPDDNRLFDPSFQITIKGLIKDVVTQLRRGLTGFWIAHPPFIRYSLALVEAWKQKDPKKLEELALAILNKNYHQEILDFLRSPDVESLKFDHPLYPRSLIIADLKESKVIANNDPKEIRYNVTQSLHYLAHWIAGNTNSALSSTIQNTPVHILDDLATIERSRWEVWHEIHHGRFDRNQFLKIVHEEMHRIRKSGLITPETEKAYPLAEKVMTRLMTDPKPVDFCTELLLPLISGANKIEQDPGIIRFNNYFSICGSLRFASTLAKNISVDLDEAKKIILSFSLDEILESAHFHGDIGESKKTLDEVASKEQGGVLKENESKRLELKKLGAEYLSKFGFKYLISAQGKTGDDILQNLKQRLGNSQEQEIQNAKAALWEISFKRLKALSDSSLKTRLDLLLKKHSIKSAQIAVSSDPGANQTITLGECTPETYFELASLSKPLASCYALEYFKNKKIPLSTPVNKLYQFKQLPRVELTHLMNHQALNMHYVPGVSASQAMPPVTEWLKDVDVQNEPGSAFQYSGGGFLVLEHLIESLEKKSIQNLTVPFFERLGLSNCTFEQKNIPGKNYAKGYLDDGSLVEGTRKLFPAFAAGAMGTATDYLKFLEHLTKAFHSKDTNGPISHETAVQMLKDTDISSRSFMGVNIGLGIFIGEAGRNRLAIHQGANDGFRCLNVYCYKGPDQGKGFVILCNSDNQGVTFIAEAAQLILQDLKMSGINTTRFKTDFDTSKLKQEEIVNLGYKNLIFGAFEPDLPEAITRDYEKDPLSRFNLAVGAEISEVTNQRFARAENLISPFAPVFDPELYGTQGKIMDSWESVRHNPKGQDSLVLKLKKSSQISYASFSTKFHNGNHPTHAALEGWDSKSSQWTSLVPQTKLDGHAIQLVSTLNSKVEYEKIRVTMFPDGGLTRLGLYDSSFDPKLIKNETYQEPIPHSQKPLAPKYTKTHVLPQSGEFDLACSAYGAKIVSASNEHYGPAAQILSPYPPLDMFDGFESARSRTSGHTENVVIQLAKKSKVKRIEVDFKFYVNNNPVALELFAEIDGSWKALTEKTTVKAFAANQIVFQINETSTFEKLKIVVHPDGGMNRVRVYA